METVDFSFFFFLRTGEQKLINDLGLLLSIIKGIFESSNSCARNRTDLDEPFVLDSEPFGRVSGFKELTLVVILLSGLKEPAVLATE